jgi:hypothetical protein
MEVAEIGTTERGWPGIVDKMVTEVDHLIFVNRVTEVTERTCQRESCLLQMSVVGLGWCKGAESKRRLWVR